MTKYAHTERLSVQPKPTTDLPGQDTLPSDALRPALLTLFGTTGDLAVKKLFPALFALHQADRLAPAATVLGVGRRPWDDATYRDYVGKAVQAVSPATPEMMAGFLRRFFYQRVDLDKPEDFAPLWERSDALQKQRGFGGDRLYFLATAPAFFPIIAERIGEGQPRKPGAFRRLMIEKPFGNDLASAETFNRSLRRSFAEEEIYRIDHYLGKSMLQNILVLRFANRIFEPAWRAAEIDHIQIAATETIGIGTRNEYYEQSGALRDMVQSHLLQLVALLTMERPRSAAPDDVRKAKVGVLRRLHLYDGGQTGRKSSGTRFVLGQYGPGTHGQQAIVSYLEENGIAAGSQTETFAALRLEINRPRWSGMPIYIRTGKRLDRSAATVTIVFRSQPGLDNSATGVATRPNALIIRVQPQEGVDLQFSIKKPGMDDQIQPVHMNFCQNCDGPSDAPQAYEKLIYDAWNGDLSLFTSWAEIEATWRFIDAIRLSEPPPLHLYAAGSRGPAEADRLIETDGRRWLDV